MSVLGDLHEAHKARRARLFPVAPPRIAEPEAPEPQPAPTISSENAARMWELSLQRLIQEAERLAAARFTEALRPVTVQDIIRIVAAFYNLPASTLTSPLRKAKVVRPRQVAMYLADELTFNSLLQLGRKFGRDHTTVLHAIRKIGALRQTNERLDDEIHIIHRRIAEHFEVPA